MNNPRKKAGGFLIFIAVFAGIAAVIMLLWNAILPSVTGWGTLSYWHAAGLLILCRLLLGGIGKFQFGGFMMGMGHKNKQMREEMKSFHDKFHCLSQEERRNYIRKRMAGIDEELDNQE